MVAVRVDAEVVREVAGRDREAVVRIAVVRVAVIGLDQQAPGVRAAAAGVNKVVEDVPEMVVDVAEVAGVARESPSRTVWSEKKKPSRSAMPCRKARSH